MVTVWYLLLLLINSIFIYLFIYLLLFMVLGHFNFLQIVLSKSGQWFTVSVLWWSLYIFILKCLFST